MKNRVLINNGKSSILKATLPSTYAEFVSAMAAGTQKVDITPNDDLNTDPGVTEVGTALNVANLLADATATKLGLTSDATPNDAFDQIGDALEVVNTVQFLVADWVADSDNGGYKAVKTVSGITANSKPFPSLHYSTMTESTCKSEQKAMAKITHYVTGAGTITAHAYAIPAVSIYVDFKGV